MHQIADNLKGIFLNLKTIVKFYLLLPLNLPQRY